MEHQFLYTRGSRPWVGVVFEFLNGRDGAPLYEGLSDSTPEKESVEQLARNFRKVLLNGSLYQEVDLLEVRKFDGRYFATLVGHFYEDSDLCAVHGRFDSGRLTFFRTHAALDQASDTPQTGLVAITSLNEMIKNCSFNEA